MIGGQSEVDQIPTRGQRRILNDQPVEEEIGFREEKARGIPSKDPSKTYNLPASFFQDDSEISDRSPRGGGPKRGDTIQGIAWIGGGADEKITPNS